MENEKKVEYLELIYDLMFVYIIGRNHSLIHHIENHFITGGVYLTFLLCTITALFVWYQTTLFINQYGSNGLIEHIGIFVNMYLLYYMAEGTRVNWHGYYTRYSMAWGLIFLNLAFMYYYKLRKSPATVPEDEVRIKDAVRSLLIMAFIIIGSILVHNAVDIVLSPLALLYGIVDMIRKEKVHQSAIDFSHFTERVMLFLIYLYMLLRFLFIISLNNVTAGLEFLRERSVAVLPKNILLVGSLLAYVYCLFLLSRYSKKGYGFNRLAFVRLVVAALVYVCVITLCYKTPAMSMAASCIFVYFVFWMVYRFYRSLIRR